MSQPISEHRLRLRFGTLVAAFALLAMTIICLAGTIMYIYLGVTGRDWQVAALWAAPTAAMAALFVYATWRLMTRVLCIRRIRLLSPATIELFTWRGDVLHAQLPGSIENVLIVQNETVLHLKVGMRRLIVSTDDFTESATIKSWLQASGLEIGS